MSYTFVVISFQYLNSVYSPKSHQVIDFRRFLSRKMERENVKVVKKKKKRREKKNIDEKFISKLESRRKPRCKASFLRFSKEIFIFFSFFFPLFMYIFIYLYNMCNIYIYIYVCIVSSFHLRSNQCPIINISLFSLTLASFVFPPSTYVYIYYYYYSV